MKEQRTQRHGSQVRPGTRWRWPRGNGGGRRDVLVKANDLAVYLDGPPRVAFSESLS